MTLEKINKTKARNLFRAGHRIVAIPHRMDPNNSYFSMGAIVNQAVRTDFDKFCDHMTYYNCSSETGRYLAFYRIVE